MKAGGDTNSQIKLVNDCCSNQIISDHLAAKFISVNDQKIEINHTGFLTVLNNSFQVLDNIIEKNLLFETSPPLKHSASIYVTYHKLLI